MPPRGLQSPRPLPSRRFPSAPAHRPAASLALRLPPSLAASGPASSWTPLRRQADAPRVLRGTQNSAQHQLAASSPWPGPAPRRGSVSSSVTTDRIPRPHASAQRPARLLPLFREPSKVFPGACYWHDLSVCTLPLPKDLSLYSVNFVSKTEQSDTLTKGGLWSL